MSKQLTVQQGPAREELVRVLGGSLYVGAKNDSIGMVIDYCTAANLDPMQKPVHIVPMNTRNAQTGNYEWRDVIMPGIGLYRIQADRSGTMAGISEPEFGQDITATMKDKNNNDVTVTFPEWCRVTIKKLIGQHIVDFVAKEYWLENYATDSSKSDAPNTMWKKRPKGQIAKCAEAQALRKAFPEIGAQPTAEEMEGKAFDVVEIVNQEQQIEQNTFLPVERFNEFFTKWESLILGGKQTPKELIAFVTKKGIKLSPEQVKTIEDIEMEGAA